MKNISFLKGSEIMDKKIKILMTILLMVGLIIILMIFKYKKIGKIEDEIQIEPSTEIQNVNEDISENYIELENEVIEENTNEVSKINNNIAEESKEEKSHSENNTKEIIETTEKSSTSTVNVESSFDESAFVNQHLKNYPDYGTIYATLKINKINVNSKVYFGLTDQMLSKGICHDTGSYLPGENGSIIMCGHNYMNNFSKLR